MALSSRAATDGVVTRSWENWPRCWRGVDWLSKNPQRSTKASPGKEAGKVTPGRERPRVPSNPDLEWDMRVDLNRQLRFPTEITITAHHPDVAVWSNKAKV